VSIQDFSWAQGSYGTSDLTIYVDLDEVGTVKDSVKVIFTADSVDMTVHGLNGKNYRLLQQGLEHDILPGAYVLVHN
jgi:hypothetical protein